MTNVRWPIELALVASGDAGFPPAHLTSIVLGALLVLLWPVAIGMLALSAYRLRDTTLVVPICWTIVAVVLCFIAFLPLKAMLGLGSHDWIITHLAAVSSFCPAISVLGAKRPQNRAWPFVTCSFLLIVLMPEVLGLLGQENPQQTHTVWKWFFGGLIFIGWGNYLPTRLGAAASVWAVAQVGAFFFQPWMSAAPLGFLPAAAVILAMAHGRKSPDNSAGGWNRVWRDFRDCYGAAWGLRVMERINALAKSTGAAVALDWSGFRTASDTAPAEPRAPTRAEMARLEGGLRTLLGKFVSSQWIDARLEPTITADGA